MKKKCLKTKPEEIAEIFKEKLHYSHTQLRTKTKIPTNRGVNDTLILASYSGSAREKLEFGSVIVEPSSSSSSSSYRANRVRVYQYPARAGS